jgi:hypothetical protein
MDPKFKKLLNSKVLDVHRWSAYPQVKVLTESIYQVFRDKGYLKNKIRKQKSCLRVLLLDLYVVNSFNPKTYICLSLNRNDYITGGRYRSLHITYDPLKRMIDCLTDEKYISLNKGFYDHEKQSGFQTRIRPLKKLVKLFDLSDINPSMIQSVREPLVLKDDDKEKIGSDEIDMYMNISEEQKQYLNSVESGFKSNLKLINDHLAAHAIDLSISDNEFKIMSDKAKGIEADDNSDSKHKFTKLIEIETIRPLYRVFNNKRFDQGGRFYGGFWLEIPKDYRQYITIDGHPTVEVDFSSFHPRLLYHFANKDAPDDPYDIGECIFDRKDMKKLVNTMINALDFDEAWSGFNGRRRGYTKAKTVKVMQQVNECHSEIKCNFYTGKGTFLQFLDSCIAENVMLRAIEEHHTIVLPIHDSFICVEGMESILINLMKEEYADKTRLTDLDSVKLETKERASDYEDIFIPKLHSRSGESFNRATRLLQRANDHREKTEIKINTDYYSAEWQQSPHSFKYSVNN